MGGESGESGGGEEELPEGASEVVEALDGIGDVLGAANGVIGAVEGLEEGEAGELLEGIEGASGGVAAITNGIGELVPEGEAREALNTTTQVANTVGAVARGLNEIVEAGAELLESLIQPQAVDYHFEVSGEEDVQFHVDTVEIEERLGEIYRAAIEVSCPRGSDLDEQALLGRDVHLSLTRGEERRSLRGIVRHTAIHEDEDERIHVHFDVVPALFLLSQTKDSRVFQDVTVPDLVEQIFDEYLSSRQRSVRNELNETYPSHEYLVQYRESHYAFLRRLCGEEGIFFYFDHEGDHEVLVLADTNQNRPSVRESDDGRVPFEPSNHTEGHEVARRVTRSRQVGPTDAVISGYDWTNPDLSVRDERVERGEVAGPALEVHDHHHAVRYHEYDEGGGQHRSNTASRDTRLSTERLDLTRSSWEVISTVVTATAGWTFDLQGADELDGRYLIVGMKARGRTGRRGGEFENRLDVVPIDLPFRPPLLERPMMAGPETARVVGPAGEEVHTDKHGRIKVQFHWDRRGQRNDDSGTWLRVSQAWAGAGWGTIFIPRIDMEVIVSFLGGDPDRPIVTGCVYNGSNSTPYGLPDRKTVSTIKTNSSKGGGGFNELRFEDEKGQEEVFIHAQKDFNEVVEHNHSTHVKNDQSNTVDHDQTENIGNNQTLDVQNDRQKTVVGYEFTTVMKERHETVNQSEFVAVDMNREHTIHQNEKLMVHGAREHTVLQGETISVQQGQENTVVGDRTTTIVNHDNLSVAGENNISVGTHFSVVHGSAASLLLRSHIIGETTGQVVFSTANCQLGMNSKGEVLLQAGSSLKLKCGLSEIELTSGEITIRSLRVKIEARTGDVDVKSPAGEIKLNC